MDTNHKQVTSIEEIKSKVAERENGVIINLPSGFNVRAKQLSLTRLLKENRVPANLVGMITSQLNGKFKDKEMTKEELQKSAESMDYMMTEIIIEPVFVLKDPKENEVSVDVLTDADKGVLWTYAQEGIEALEKFRKE